MFFQETKFDKAVIYMVRKMVKNFLNLNSEKTMNGFPLNMIGAAEGMTMEEYIDRFILKMQEDA